MNFIKHRANFEFDFIWMYPNSAPTKVDPHGNKTLHARRTILANIRFLRNRSAKLVDTKYFERNRQRKLGTLSGLDRR